MGSRPIYVFLPAYNEEENIAEVVNGLGRLNLDLKIFVIDDGSEDDTAQKALEAGADVIRHPINLGGGAVLRTAFKVAILNDVDYIVTLDGDGQHDPKEIVNIISAVEDGADLVVGSRFLGSQDLEMPRYRFLGIKFFSWLVSKVLKERLSDTTSCYRAYRMSQVKKVFSELSENQYYALEVMLKMAWNGANMVEVPITGKPRKRGKSKKGVIKYGYNLARTVIKTVLVAKGHL